MNNATSEIIEDMDSAPQIMKDEYGTWADGYDARLNGLQCPPEASKRFLVGYGRYYEEEAKAENGYTSNSLRAGEIA